MVFLCYSFGRHRQNKLAPQVKLLGPFQLYSLEGGLYAQPALREGRVMVEYLPKLLEILLHKWYFCSFSFICSIIYISINSWVLILCFGLHLFCSSFSSFGHWEFFQLTSVSIWHISIVVRVFSSFLALESHLVYFLLQKKETCFLTGERYWKPRSGYNVCSLLLVCHCFKSLLGDRAQRYMCECNSTCTNDLVYIHIIINISNVTMWMSIKSSISSYDISNLIHSHKDQSSLLPLVTSHSNSEKPGSDSLPPICLIIQFQYICSVASEFLTSTSVGNNVIN